jgi:DNA (cytosine-5)-methyltransferase 1
LIAATREAVRATGQDYIIENVVDALPHLITPIRLCGTSFGLPLRRHRLFESNIGLLGMACAHSLFREPRYWTSWRPGGEVKLATTVQVYGHGAGRNRASWKQALGIDWMTDEEMTQAIPPAYTEFIGAQLLTALEVAP